MRAIEVKRGQKLFYVSEMDIHELTVREVHHMDGAEGLNVKLFMEERQGVDICTVIPADSHMTEARLHTTIYEALDMRDRITRNRIFQAVQEVKGLGKKVEKQVEYIKGLMKKLNKL